MRNHFALTMVWALAWGLPCLSTLVVGCDDGPQQPEPAVATAAEGPGSPAEPMAEPAGEPAAAPSEAPAETRTGPLALGATAPMVDHPMRNVDGTQTTIEAVGGEKGTLVVFTCNHCPWAQAWQARLTALGNEYPGRGIGVIAINPNDPEQYAEDGFEPMQALAREAGMEFPYVVDDTSDVARAYGATKTPEAFLFDADRALVYHGAIDDNAHEEDQVEERYLRDALEALASGGAISRTETRAMGCSIKFRGEG